MEIMKRRATATTVELRDFAAGGESCTVYSKEAVSTDESDIPLIMLQSNDFLYNNNFHEPYNDYNPQQYRERYYNKKDDDFSFSTISTKNTQFSDYYGISFLTVENVENETVVNNEDEGRDDFSFLSPKTPSPKFCSPPPLDFFVECRSNNNNDENYFTEGFVNVGRLPGVY